MHSYRVFSTLISKFYILSSSIFTCHNLFSFFLNDQENMNDNIDSITIVQSSQVHICKRYAHLQRKKGIGKKILTKIR